MSSIYFFSATTPALHKTGPLEEVLPILQQHQVGAHYTCIVSREGIITLTPVASTSRSPLFGHQQSTSAVEIVEMSLPVASTCSTPSPYLFDQQQPSSSTSSTPSPSVSFPQCGSAKCPLNVTSQSLSSPSNSETQTPSPTTPFPQVVSRERSSQMDLSFSSRTTTPSPTDSVQIADSVVRPTEVASTPNHFFEQQQHRILTSTPVSVWEESATRHFRPCDILPIPKVLQTGPRIARPNKRLQEARNLTSELEVKKIKEAYEAKELKKKKKEEASIKKAMVCANLTIIDRYFCILVLRLS